MLWPKNPSGALRCAPRRAPKVRHGAPQGTPQNCNEILKLRPCRRPKNPDFVKFSTKDMVSGVRERRQWIRNAILSRIQVSMTPDQFPEAVSNNFHAFSSETQISCREVFRKHRSSHGSLGQSANWKMILYRSSNFHKFIKKLDLDCFLQVAFHLFMEKHVLHFEPSGACFERILWEHLRGVHQGA